MSEQRRTPDYDFFATGAPTGAPAGASTDASSGSFGHTAAHFGAQAQAQQAGTTPPQFRGPPPQFGHQPPQFGSPPPQFGSPPPQGIGAHGTQPAKRSGALRLVAMIAVPVGITLVLAVFGLGRFAGLFDGEMQAPPVLAGASIVTGPMAEMFEATAHEDLEGVSAQDATAAFYGVQADSPDFILLAARARMDVDYEFADGGFTEPRSTFGDVVCGLSDDAQVSMCMRTGRRLTVLVAVNGTADLSYLAGVTDEGWKSF